MPVSSRWSSLLRGGKTKRRKRRNWIRGKKKRKWSETMPLSRERTFRPQHLLTLRKKGCLACEYCLAAPKFWAREVWHGNGRARDRYLGACEICEEEHVERKADREYNSFVELQKVTLMMDTLTSMNKWSFTTFPALKRKEIGFYFYLVTSLLYLRVHLLPSATLIFVTNVAL